jgi:hypothetical protein
MGNVTLTSDSKVTIKDGSKLQITSIDKVAHVAPVAVHLKEVNHIDPLTIDALHISEVKNIDPLEITRFNVTSLPMVNVSLQPVPPVDINIKSLPAISIGVHQNFCIPSEYTLRARVLGIELMRLHLSGQSTVIPQDRARREQMRSDNKSFPVVSAVGNPAIPSKCEQRSSTVCTPRPAHPAYHAPAYHAAPAYAAQPVAAAPPTYAASGFYAPRSDLSFGAPRTAFQIPAATTAPDLSEHRVMSGE